MREYSELQDIVYNESMMKHINEAIEYITLGATAIAVPVALTTGHSVYRNFNQVSVMNALNSADLSSIEQFFQDLF